VSLRTEAGNEPCRGGRSANAFDAFDKDAENLDNAELEFLIEALQNNDN